MKTSVINSSVEDMDLVLRLQEGQDSKVFELLYDRFADKVFHKCFTFVKDTDSAADLTQEVFVKIYMKIGSFKGQSRLSTWIYSLTYNMCIDYMRKNKKRLTWSPLSSSEESIAYSIDEVEEETLFAIDTETLVEMLELLKPEDKALLLMKYQDNASIKEIQQITGLAASAIKMRLKRARQRIIGHYEKKKAAAPSASFNVFSNSVSGTLGLA